MMQGGCSPLFRWSGGYVGFVAGGCLYDAGGVYLGWCETEGSVWRADGRPLGALVDGCYVLRNLHRSAPVRRTPRVPPLPVPPPVTAGPRLARQPRPGWEDALEHVAQMPAPRDLEGRWGTDDACLELSAAGDFRWIGPGDMVHAGRWHLVDRLLELEVDSGPVGPGRFGLQVVHFDQERETLSLRRSAGRSLPFTLRRECRRD
jgi:4-fold beta flower protein